MKATQKMLLSLTPTERGTIQHRLAVKANVAAERHGEDSEKAARRYAMLGRFAALTARVEVR